MDHNDLQEGDEEITGALVKDFQDAAINASQLYRAFSMRSTKTSCCKKRNIPVHPGWLYRQKLSIVR